MANRRRWIFAGALAGATVGGMIGTGAAEATLLFQFAGMALGAAFGGPVGAMIGGMIGGLIGGLIFGSDAPTTRGPRLTDKTVQSGAFGAHINKTWGTDRVPAQLIFSSGLKEKKHKIDIGKGFPSGQSAVYYTYSVDLMLSFGHRAKGVKRLWADTKLIFDATGEADIKKKWLKEGRKFVVRDGNEDQLPSALEESYHGAGQCSAHRGLFCLEAENFQLADFVNRVPNFTAEIYTEGDDTFQKIASYTPPDPPGSYWTGSWGYIDPNGELWAMYYPSATPYPYPGYATTFHWTLANPDDPIEEFHPYWSDPTPNNVIQSASVANYIRVRSDEPSAAAFGTNSPGVALSYFQLEAGSRIDIMDDEVNGPSIPEILVKSGQDMFVWFSSGSFVTTPMLIKFDIDDDTQLGSRLDDDAGAIYAATTSGSLTDLGASETYIWALVGATLFKLDRDDLTILATLTITGHTGIILAMAVISDAEIRVVTADSGGVRFYTIDVDTGAATLDRYAENDGYPAWRAFGRWGLRYQNGMYIVDFGGYVGGFDALIDFYADHPPTEDIPLWKIVRDINLMSGLDSVVDTVPPTVGDIEVSELTDLVHGYTITRPMTARDALVQLQQCYFFDGRETDFKLDYPKRGHTAVREIPGDDLAARSSLTENLPDRLTLQRSRETELPLRVHVIYNNFEFAYQSGHEYAPRLITDARATMTVEIAVAIDSTYARKIAQTLLALAWLERESFSMKSSRKNFRIDAADNLSVTITEVA